MEDSKNLIDELLAKLAELDSKVASYRQDMLGQFHNFSDNLLKNVPENVSTEVSRVIAESMARYPSLSMPSRVEPDSPAASTSTEVTPPRDGRKSPPPILWHTSGIPKIMRSSPRGPHDREAEFRGVFTPTYLPLLERPLQQEPWSPTTIKSREDVEDGFEGLQDHSTATRPPVRAPDNAEDEEGPVVVTVEEVEVPGNEDTGKGKEVIRPSPVREMTDISVSSSVGSASSDHKARRSALRRSSSSARGSPRRVRFSVEGAEVLPTASPQHSAQTAMEDMVDLELGPAARTLAFDDDSDEDAGPSLANVEGEEDYVPRPARISSTEALRRLSRTPSDDGTIWNVVEQSSETSAPSINGHDPSETEPSTTSPNIESASVSIPTTSSNSAAASSDVYHSAMPPSVNGKHAPEDLTLHTNTMEKQTESDDSDDSDEEQFLAIRRSPRKPLSPTGATSTPRSPLSGDISSQIMEDATPGLSPPSTDKGKGKETTLARPEGEDELFHFEDSKAEGSIKPEKYLAEEEEEEDEEPLPRDGKESAPTVPLNLYSTSPAVSVTQRDASPPIGNSNKRFGDSIGSYKGDYIRSSVVLDSEITRRAAAMENVKMYVGSVHGRTGIDPVDEASYRASFMNSRSPYSGTPRSLSEKFMIEEQMGKKYDHDDDYKYQNF